MSGMALQDLLGGGAPGGAPAPAAPGPGEESGPGEGGGDSVSLLGQALDLIRQAIDVEPDEEDKLTLEQCTTLLQKVKASNQKLQDTAMGAGPGAKFLRKAQGGAPSDGGGY